VLTAKDLFLNEATLTGEAMPVEKSAAPVQDHGGAPTDLPNICFMGSNVLSGAATAIVVQCGAGTYFGELAGMLTRQRAETSFDKGVTRFTWLMIRFMAVMVPSVFVINGLTKGDWLEALMFALAVAVGLTPEMLPMIVTVNLVSTPEQKCIGRPAQKCVTGSEATEGVLSGTDGGLLGRAERSSPIAA
jgi:Mg2+-importing ATPase